MAGIHGEARHHALVINARAAPAIVSGVPGACHAPESAGCGGGDGG